MLENQDAARSYREEIETALKEDTSRIGDVFREMQEDKNKSARSIADNLEISTPSTVNYYLQLIETLLECRLIAKGSKRPKDIASMVRGFSRRHSNSLSDQVKQQLSDLEDEHESFANNVNVDVIIREHEEIERALESDDRLDVPGIYVYTYPHYNSSPVEPSQEDYTDARTFLKIGVTKASEGASKRIQQQIGQVRTALPEPPLILRIYDGDGVDLKEVEKRLQKHLEAADHNQVNRQRGEGVGMEWYLTHLKFLDSTADLLGLEAKYRRPDEDDE